MPRPTEKTIKSHCLPFKTKWGKHTAVCPFCGKENTVFYKKGQDPIDINCCNHYREFEPENQRMKFYGYKSGNKRKKA